MCKNNNTPKSTIAHRAILGALTLIATLAAILIIVLALGACTPEALTDQPTTDPDTRGGTLIIGNITVGSPTDPATAGAANTRLTPKGAFAEGDKIVVKAQYYNPDGPFFFSTTYTLQSDGTGGTTWKSATPIIVERIVTEMPLTIESWGGADTSPSYEDQSTKESYLQNDVMISTDSNLEGRTLTATMEHNRVDIVVNITDGAATLPAGATLTLNYGETGIKTWNTSGTTTFRACVDLGDVPGITDISNDGTGTVGDNSLLGELTYTSGGTTKTLNVKYSIKKNGDGSAARITSGTRITVNVPFSEYDVTGTATVMSWTNTDGGEVGTTELPAGPVVTATGMEPLNAAVFNADNLMWVITGNVGSPATFTFKAIEYITITNELPS